MKSYRETFGAEESAANYDNNVYNENSIASIQWQAESELLDKIIKPILTELELHNDKTSYLDFACGTGRIISFLENRVGNATGIDISQAMLNLADKKVTSAILIQKDVTSTDDIVENQYDLVTSFRFMANSENSLRRAALKAIGQRMLKNKSILLINNHGNPFSYRLLFLPFHWARDRIHGRSLYGYYTNGSMKTLLDETGFTVEKIIGYGFVPGKALPLLPTKAALWLERTFAGKPFIGHFGATQLFVCRKTQDFEQPENDAEDQPTVKSSTVS